MMLSYAFYVLLAPTFAYAAAFPWALPEPTVFAPAPDNWSPAPTPAAQLPGFELFRRQTLEGDNTCGFVSGLSQSSITCPNSKLICATNTLYGVHGCCDPASLSSCILPTTCIASTAMSSICTDAICSSDANVLKCTDSAQPECYRWMIVYSRTTMTQHGCATKGFTSTAQRSWGQLLSSIPPELYRTITVLATPSATPTLTPSPASSKPNLGAIVGGTIGGCTVISLVILVLLIVYRRRKNARDSIKQPPLTIFHDGNGAVTEYNSQGFVATTYVENDQKTWNHGPVTRSSDAMPEYPGMGAGRYGVVEVDGVQRPVEAPAENVYHATQEYTRS